MKPETFRRLVENIKRDKCLSQLPFCALLGYFSESDPIQYLEDGVTPKWEVLSGNHRVKGGIQAGLSTVQSLVTRQPLTKAQRIAIQLSHNSISGEDDPEILRSLLEQIDDVDWRAYSGLDDKALGLIENPKITGLSEDNLEFQTVQHLFLPNEIESVQSAYAAAKGLLSADFVQLSRMSEYVRLLDAIEATGSAHGIRNTACALLMVLEIFERHLTDLRDGFLTELLEVKHKGWVPTSSVLGVTKVPAATAAVINRTVERMISRGDIPADKRWQSIERLCKAYLEQG